MKKIVFFVFTITALFAEETGLTDQKCCIQDKNHVHFVSFGEFVYWQFGSPTLSYARDGVGLTNTAPPVEIIGVNQGKSFLPHYKYSPGFKVGCSVKYGPETAFDMTAVYIRLSSDPSGSVSSGSSPLLPQNWLTSATLSTNSYSNASLKLNVLFNWIDLQSGYTIKMNKYLALRPFIALSAIVIDGKLHAHYEFTTPTSVFELADTYAKCSSWSIGPKIGLDFIIHATKNLGIFSNVNFTQQTTHISMKTQQTENRPATGVNFIIQNGKLVQNQNVGLFNLELGPTWDQWFYRNKYRLQLRTTWQTSLLLAGANLSFLNNNNNNISMVSEFRGFNIRVTFEF